jgi:HemY protein
LAIALVQGQLQYTDGQYELALATLKEVLRISPRQKQALKLLGKTYEHLNDWHHLSELLPDLQKYQAVDENQFSEMAFVAYYHVFDDVKDEKQLNHLWKQAPSYVREAADIVSLYVRALIRLNEINRADDIIRQYLKRHWDLELVLLFGQLKLENSKKQLTQAEAWLKQHAHDAVLLYILGILAERNQLWGKAKDYYLASLEIKPMPETYAAYAKLLEQQGEVKESLIYYRKGLRQLIEPAAE